MGTSSSRTTTTITPTATTMLSSASDKKRQKKRHKNSSLKIFLNRHQHTVDFLGAMLLMCLCLTVLLPRVHDSFLESADGENHTSHDQTPANEGLILETGVLPVQLSSPNGSPTEGLGGPSQTSATLNITLAKSIDLLSDQLQPKDQDQDHDDHDHHHHHHGFPVGEFLICIGFFVFYCAGFSLDDDPLTRRGSIESRQFGQALREHRPSTSTICCSSTRCPPIQQTNEQQQQHVQLTGGNRVSASGEHVVDELTLLATTHFTQPNADDDCVMLLNPHHQHHTHNKHHDQGQMTSSFAADRTKGRQANYGSTIQADDQTYAIHRRLRNGNSDSENDQLVGEPATPRPAHKSSTTTIVVDEIRIISEPSDSFVNLTWPRSLKMLLISIILAGVLILFDMKMLGMLLAVKVFRACSTGALLYVAFFIMLPKDRAGCNSCKEEET